MGEDPPQGLHPAMPTRPIASGDGLGEVNGLDSARLWDGLGEVMGCVLARIWTCLKLEIAKKCKKSAKKCNFICIYQIFFVPLQRILE